MTTGADWQAQVGRTWADNYALTDRSFAELTRRMLERIAEYGPRAVLDVGCGAGELALAIAHQHPDARVIGVDLSPDLIEAARRRGREQAEREQANRGQVGAEFVLADAASWALPGFSPDLIVSRHGGMFFDDPVAAFRHLRGVAAPSAALVFSCFRAPADNPWASSIAALLGLPLAANPRAPGPFAFADPGYVESILSAAGWQDIAFEPVDFAYLAGEGPDPVCAALDFFRRIGPAAATLRGLDGTARDAAEARIRDWLEAHRSGNRVALGASAWIVSARNS